MYIYTIPMVFVNQFINGTPKNIDYPLYGMVLGNQFPFPYISIVYTFPILDTLQKKKFFAGWYRYSHTKRLVRIKVPI